MNNYELALIIDPDLSEKEIQQLVQEVKDMLTKLGVTEFTGERLERRSLAYPIKKRREAHYLFLNCVGPPTVPEKIRFELRHREQILRMAVIRMPKPVTEPGEGAPASAPEREDVAPTGEGEVAGG